MTTLVDIDEGATTLRILSYNIHKGLSPIVRREILTQVKDLIQDNHADIVFLQEIGCPKNFAKEGEAFSNQLEVLADSVWPHYAYGKNASYSNGHHGNALLSKWPITLQENLDISVNRYEQRGLLHGCLQLVEDDENIHVFCSHLNLMGSDRQRQIDRILGYIQEKVEPGERIIFAGDFNDWNSDLSAQMLHTLGLEEAFQTYCGHHARTYPSVWPVLRLDRIYSRGFKVVNAVKLPVRFSDHLPLLADLELDNPREPLNARA